MAGGGVRMGRRCLDRALTMCAVLLCALLFALCAPFPLAAATEEDPLLGVREGWAWPVVVVPPPDGWDTPGGESVKYGMRAAEREVSLQRGAIRGREVTFMFANLVSADELPRRLETWRAMGVAVVVSFGDGAMNEALRSRCAERGPAVVFAGGEDLSLLAPATASPHTYLFALDLPYHARANAIAEAARAEVLEAPSAKAAVISDIYSRRLAGGASWNVDVLRGKGIDTLYLTIAGLRQDQYLPQVREAEADGVRFIASWLDAMATLSIWRATTLRPGGATVCYAGNAHPVLLDADGLLVVDKDVLLERDESGKHAIMIKVRDLFNRVVDEPVLSAKAYALGTWTIQAYRGAASADAASLAARLADAGEIPLMGESLSIDPATHRPVSRKFGVLRVGGREYRSAGSVEVFSREVRE